MCNINNKGMPEEINDGPMYSTMMGRERQVENLVGGENEMAR